MASARRNHARQRLCLQKRGIGKKNHDIAVKTVQRSPRLCDRMGGAKLLGLQNHFGCLVDLAHGGLNPFRAMPRNDNNARRL